MIIHDMKLEQSIIKTLAYFDIFDYPLTKEGLFRLRITDNSDLRISYMEFLNQLERLQQLQHFQHKDGFYFLAGRSEIVDIRQSRVKVMEKKLKIAYRGIKKIASVPFVRAVFVCNTLSGPGLDEDSDIDVFIIVKHGRLWLARALVTLKLSFFGLRRTKKKVKNKICLSFYLADDSLNLESIAIENDLYLMYWLAQLIPFYDPDNLLNSLQKANSWVKKFLSNALVDYKMFDKFKLENQGFCGKIKQWLEKVWQGKYGDLLEAQAKGMQQAKMKMNFSSVQNEDNTSVVINDKMLKFHESDKRVEYRELWLEKYKIYTKDNNFN